MPLQNIDIDLIDIDEEPARFRADPHDKSLKELKESLETHGQLHPVVVRKKEDGRYGLICGSRRLLAARQAGMKSITAIVYNNLQQEALWSIFLSENLHRKKLNPLDIGVICQRLKEMDNPTHDQIGEVLNLKPKTVQRYLKVTSLSEGAKDALRNNRIGFRQAVLLTQVDSAVQSRLVDEIAREKLTTRQLEHRINGKTKIYHLTIRFSKERWKSDLTSKIKEILKNRDCPPNRGDIKHRWTAQILK